MTTLRPLHQRAGPYLKSAPISIQKLDVDKALIRCQQTLFNEKLIFFVGKLLYLKQNP